ncbi:hypothetical protein BHU72_01230 [Desulfuribacillus stibiiarsenatis]|uniref:Uncharacterized protein n=1 Tax=Desulfuribacillus stibiiarsenatis TaxID=1390249 RepID=A0A1E5L9W5_9FIRM|nr:hypothetical protein [Desulfuribacillus stibiiarsenatis]OEH86912.1 hypothetical protein BHU72_01230 [Desulfuribacillus stibiiarsenatis]
MKKTRVKVKKATQQSTKKTATKKTASVQEISAPALPSEAMTIKDIHSITKDLISTFATIEKSLVLLTQLATVLEKYNINLTDLTRPQNQRGRLFHPYEPQPSNPLHGLKQLIARVNPEQVEKAVNLLQNKELSDLLNNLSSQLGQQQNEKG